MKGLKIAGVVLGAVLLLAAGTVFLALNSGVQTWAVRKAIAGQPGLKLELSRVEAGLSSAEVNDLRFSQDGMLITAKRITTRHQGWDYVSRSLINVESVSVEELVVDLRQASASAPAGAAGATGRTTGGAPSGNRPAQANPTNQVKASFEGLLREARIPVDLRLGTLSVKGRALLNAHQVVVFELKGGGVAAGAKGKLDWSVEFSDVQSGAALQSARSTGILSFQLSTERQVTGIEVETQATVAGAGLPKEPLKVRARLERATASGDEGYAAEFALVRGSSTEQLAEVRGEFRAASREIAGSWKVSFASAQLASLLAGLGLPEVAANGNGQFTLNPSTQAVTAQGQLQVQATKLANLSPALGALGGVQLKVAFDGSLADQVAKLARLDLEALNGEGRPFAKVNVLQRVTYTLNEKRISLADPKAELARIALTSVPLAWAQPVAAPHSIESGELSLILAVEAAPDGSRIRVRSVEPITARSVTVRSGGQLLADRLSVTLDPSIDYSPGRIQAQIGELKLVMPSGDSLAAKLNAEVANADKAPVVTFSARFDAKAPTALKPFLPIDPGPLAIAAMVEGRQENGLLHLAQATAAVTRAEGAMLAAIELRQPVRIDLKSGQPTANTPDAPAARVRIGKVPLAWADAFVANAKLAGSLEGIALEVTLRSASDLAVTTTEPVLLKGVGAVLNGQPALRGLDLAVEFSASRRGDALTYQVRRLELSESGAPLIGTSLEGSAGLGPKARISAKGRLSVDLAAVLRQPALAPFATLSKGTLTTSFDATLADTIKAQVTVAAKGLTARQGNRALGDVELRLDADFQPDRGGRFALPLTLTNAGRKSDLTVEGTVGSEKGGKLTFSGKVAGNQLYVDDFEPLAALAPESPKAAPKPTTAAASAANRRTPPAREAQQPPHGPFWGNVNGRLEVELKRILYGKDYVISGVKGTAVITDSRLALEGLEGRFKENPFKVAAGITYTLPQSQPYSLVGSMGVTNFDVGEFLRAANPGEPPSLESKVSVNAKLNGTGADLDDLLQRVQGQFELEGSKGVTRMLARKGGAGQAVNLASTALSILGAARGSDTTSALGTLAGTMNEMAFDRFTMKVERDAQLNLRVSTLEFISPIMRLTGSGGLTPTGRAGETIQEQPMSFTFQLAAKGQFAAVLNRAGVLGGQQDEKGFYKMTQTFRIAGTPAQPDSSQLWQMLGAAAARAAAGALLR